MFYLACFGDSLVQGFPFGNSSSWVAGLEKQDDIKVLNYGLCGDCADDIFDRMRFRALPAEVKHIVFLGGANDILQGVPEKFTLDIMGKVIKWCEEKHYKLCLVLPLISSDAWMNRRLLNLRQEIEHKFADKAFLLDLQPAIGLTEQERAKAYLDGVHPTDKSYSAMGEYARPLVLEWLRRSEEKIAND